MHSKDFILHKESVLSSENCNNIINFFEGNSHLHKRGQRSIDTEMFLETVGKTPINSVLAQALSVCTDEYHKEYPFINKIKSWTIAPTFKLQRYNPEEGYFTLHCENDGGVDGSAEKRILAWMVYLNDVTDGGETEFPTQCKKIAPRAGDVLVWPAYWTHPHRGIVSPTQTKYIVTGWYSFTEDTDAIKH